MKYFIGLSLLLGCQSSFAGFFVDKSMYTETYLAIGRGHTRLEAVNDAMKAIPAATKYIKYEPNSSWNSPVIQCLESGVWTEARECDGNEIQYIIPLRKIEQ